MHDKCGILSDFGFEIVVTYFKLSKEDQAIHAAMRAVFRDCVSSICGFSDAQGSRTRAAKVAIEKIEPRYILLRHTDNFFNDMPTYNKEALTWAVIAGDLLFDAGYCEELARNHDERPISKARRILEDCSALKGEEHFENYSFSAESLFMLHIDALEDLAYLELHFEGWSLEELQDKHADSFSLYKKYLRPETVIGQELRERIRIAETKIADFMDGQRPYYAPKPVHNCEVIAFPFPKQ
jgi:hypothetical protein